MLCDGKREEYYSYCCTHISGRHLADCLYDTILQQYSTFFCRSPSSSTFSFFFFRFPFISCTAFFILFSLPCPHWWRILFFGHGATPPRALLRACKSAYSLVCFLFSCFLAFMFCFRSFPFSISIWKSICFILSFCCGYYAVSSFSVATRSAYLHTYVYDTYLR